MNVLIDVMYHEIESINPECKFYFDDFVVTIFLKQGKI